MDKLTEQVSRRTSRGGKALCAEGTARTEQQVSKNIQDVKRLQETKMSRS